MSEPTLLLTRPLEQSESFLADLTAALGHAPKHIISPLIRIENLPLTQDISNAQALLFTSTNGVAALAGQTYARKPPALCVGPSTCNAATVQGFAAQNADGTASDLLYLAKQTLSPENGPILHISGQQTAHDLAASLSSAGYDAKRVIVYNQHPQPLSHDATAALKAGKTILPVFSPKTAETLRHELTPHNLDAIHCICISQTAAEPLKGLKMRISTATAPNRDAMIAAIAAALSL